MGEIRVQVPEKHDPDDAWYQPRTFAPQPDWFCPSCGVKGHLWEEDVIDDDVLCFCLACGAYVQVYVFPAEEQNSKEVASLRRGLRKAVKQAQGAK
jgi:hypothetical protein